MRQRVERVACFIYDYSTRSVQSSATGSHVDGVKIPEDADEEFTVSDGSGGTAAHRNGTDA